MNIYSIKIRISWMSDISVNKKKRTDIAYAVRNVAENTLKPTIQIGLQLNVY